VECEPAAERTCAVQAESARTGAAMSEEEIASQMRTLIAAGYESTSGPLARFSPLTHAHVMLQRR
jgi:cytochrome P450